MASNRPPGKHLDWWKLHEKNCGGRFIKVHEPEEKKFESFKHEKCTNIINKEENFWIIINAQI